MSDRLDQLRLAVETMHHRTVSHEAATPILEKFCGLKVGKGVAESFAHTGHPKANQRHAWSYQDTGEIQYVTARDIPPFESPITAVRAAIAADAEGKK